MNASTPDNFRAVKLSKHLDSIIHGRQPLTSKNSRLFLEAVCASPDAATCVNNLIASPKGLPSLQASFRFDLSEAFFNGPAAALLQYLSAPELTSISGGSFLQQVLLAIVEPPIFWTQFQNAFLAGKLHEDAQVAFAWLLLQLILLPEEQASAHREFAQGPCVLDVLLASASPDIRSAAQKIKHVLTTRGVVAPVDLEYGPGGRHDNDFVDFRQIAILPTEDELRSRDAPFLRPSSMLDDPETAGTRVATHLDNQFRLLREDMLDEMREELKASLDPKKKGKRHGFVLDGLELYGIYYKAVDDDKKYKWGIQFKCRSDLWQFTKDRPMDRQKYLKDNRNVFKHQSMACLIFDGEIAAFATVHRDEILLAQQPPVVVLRLEGHPRNSVFKTLLKLPSATHIKLLQIDTAVFAYEPVLTSLQEKQSLTLAPELLLWNEGVGMQPPPNWPLGLVQAIHMNPLQNLQGLLRTPGPIELDEAQAASLLCGLTQRVSLIQGPPGTGKSFIGALLAKVLHDFAMQTILVVCYTNHALDQFLEDLLDIGIPETSMVRLGGKSTLRTAPLALRQTRIRTKREKADWAEIHALRISSDMLSQSFVRDFQQYKSFNPGRSQILEHLEFSHPEYFEAFRLPDSESGMQQVGRTGRAATSDYLMGRWVEGKDAGSLQGARNVKEASKIWEMPLASRRAQFNQWKQEMLTELVEHFCQVASKYNDIQGQLDRKLANSDALTLRSKRIIGCTTTAAAMYRRDISAARPGVLLVEEAGEILESHVLTALGAETKQLILIGDHKQLRPKVNNYRLTVEKGEGYDLNRSLFERLVIKGYPHQTLREQHRMRPEISALVRHLTYPDLMDAPNTKNRPDLLGVRDYLVFINHDKPEDEFLQAEERRDFGAKSSKHNKFEVQMVLKIVRYLGQQGYGTSKIVILTPYLGQLRELQEALKRDNDPVLNDLDSYDLIRAGLVSQSAAKMTKAPIRLATIDNYQGEESDIVIASLTRSNSDHDIGFMSSPERLTVLLSRARNAFIMIGNSDTFMNARKGSEIWNKLFKLLKRDGHIYDGLPVRCERHPDRTGLLKSPDDFLKECPDGGCLQPCGAMLSCTLHPCPSKCHQLVDHSKMPCEFIMQSKCSKGHLQQWKCHVGPPALCAKCDKEQKAAEKKQREAFALQEKRDEEIRLHAQQIAELDDQIAQEREALRDTQLAEERRHALQQKQKDLKEATAMTAKASTPHPQATGTVSPLASTPQNSSSSSSVPPTEVASPTQERSVTPKPFSPPVKSVAREQWQRQKNVDGETNDAIDAIMEMTGLEEVKMQVLRIKDKVDTNKRQNASLADERFNVSMLGNPGTGKTTVARYYGKFLASVQVIPSNMFVETTGSRLANNGIPGIKNILEEVINAGGGTIFVDEAYQLTSEHNVQGGQVLDFLLAEMENNIGKIVFIFAGYNNEMEKFFEHNPGLKSRIPYSLRFEDYQDGELLEMLEKLIGKKYKGRMQVEGGIRGLYGRIAVRRLGRGRGQNGFGNARALANMFAKISERQSHRLSKERVHGHPDDFLLKKEDLIGPDPAKVRVESQAWKELQSMIGLTAVKKSVMNLFSMVDSNYQRELLEKEPHQVSLNRVFLGSPGTGKTSVAKHYGQILADLGLISNGEVVVKNPADFIGGFLGHSESQTKAILANTMGKVLIIDEAYMLYGGPSPNGQDSFKTAVIDTIVAEVQSVPGEDRCVLLLGYKEKIEEMFQNVNPGLSRRFAIENAFNFADYTDSELLQALEWKLRRGDLTATDAAKSVAIEVLSRARIRPNFGNIGEVENLLTQAKLRYQTRQETLPLNQRSPDAPFEPQDFDPEFNRNENAATNLTRLFEDVVGCEDTVQKLGTWQEMAKNMKALGIDAREFIPTNFVFKGPPGTGKTTTARKMGQVYYDMGFLSSTEVVECSASDLVGQYVGHTGPKTTKLFEKALGRVLFIDEAYRLSEGQFAKEAMDELVGLLTQERFRGKLIVILAGYGPAMNELMAVNDGLSSRFPNEIYFQNLTPVQCLEVLRRKLGKLSIHVDALEDPASAEYSRIVSLLGELSVLPSWGNARDLEELSKQMMTIVFTSSPPPSNGATKHDADNYLTLDGKSAVACFETMLSGRRERTTNVHTRVRPVQGAQQIHNNPAPPPPPIITTAKQARPPSSHPATEQVADRPPDAPEYRDAGVSDEVWHQLQLDKQKSADAAKRSQEAVQGLEQELQEAMVREAAAKARAKQLAKAHSEGAELMREREEARLREIKANEERARIAAAIEDEKRKQREEARVQTKLRQMGICVMGYRWIKQSSGYRCAGGSHFISDGQLGI